MAHENTCGYRNDSEPPPKTCGLGHKGMDKDSKGFASRTCQPEWQRMVSQ